MPGLAIHEVGSARMGNDPKTSVLEPRGSRRTRSRTCIVMDGAVYPELGLPEPDAHHDGARLAGLRATWWTSTSTATSKEIAKHERRLPRWA
jgi:hypothetical protein